MNPLSLVKDAGALVGVVALSEIAKRLDSGKKLKRFYVLFPVVWSIVAALVVASPFMWQTVGQQALTYAGAATLLYKVGKTTVLGK